MDLAVAVEEEEAEDAEEEEGVADASLLVEVARTAPWIGAWPTTTAVEGIEEEA